MQKQSAAGNRSRGSLTAVLAVLLFVMPLAAQDAATVALLVHEQNLEPLGPALKSPDALTRAAAARVALVRSVDTLVPQLREALAAEKDAPAAREQMRAVVLLGSDEDVAFAAEQIKRFPASIDSDFGAAVARLGAPRSTALYFKHVAGSRDPEPAIELALWGRSAQTTGTAARFLGATDERGFREVLSAAAEAKVPIEPGVLQVALTSESRSIVEETVWYLAKAHAAEPAKLPEMLREPATTAREGEPVEVAFGREVLRRMLGAAPVERKEVLAWLNTEAWESRIPGSKAVYALLTPGEQKAMKRESLGRLPQGPPQGSHRSREVIPPVFHLPVMLPPGLADQILSKTRCTGGWIGVAKATVDRAGRVQTLDAKEIADSPACSRALETFLRLSLASPETIASGLTNKDLVVVKPRGRTICADDDPLSDVVRVSSAPQRVGGKVTAPVVKKRVEPRFPESVRQEMQGGSVVVIVEAVITKTGCVRNLRLLSQSQWPVLNAAALLALAEWKFKPGALDGVPVDVIFNLTINFKMN